MKQIIILSTILFVNYIQSFSQANIAEARTFSIGTIVTITGIVTNGNEFGSTRYIEDGSAGIALYPGFDWSNWSEPVLGDEVTVSGELFEFYGLLEVQPITAFAINSSGNPIPTPQLITPSQLNESTEGELVKIENAVFTNAGSNFSSTTFEFTSNGESSVIYLRSGHPVIGSIVPAGEVTLIGIASQYTFDMTPTGYQLLPRGFDDIILSSSINLLSPLSQNNITTNSFDLKWTTDAAGSYFLRYGLDENLDQLVENAGPTNNPVVPLSGFMPATFVYAKGCSVLGNDTICSNVGLFSTQSESTGMIQPYFNQEVNLSVSTGVDAITTQHINDTIIKYLNLATQSIDMAVYNTNNTPIVTALNNAYNNGVTVRVVTEGTNTNQALSSLNPNIEVLERLDGMGSGMHNKFFIIDPETVNNSYVIMGSMNMTNTDMFDDYNNIVVIQDQALAKAYTLEMNEMWGSTGPVPNQSNSKFGEDKSNNSPHDFIIGGIHVESYFSPSDGTTAKIAKAILSTDNSFEFALFVFTNDELRDAVLEINDLFFVTPQGIIDNISTGGSDYLTLLGAGVEVESHEGVAGLLHHKYAIVDQIQPSSDPVVITGSHNWSASAESLNDENTLIIHDATIANIYYQEFSKRYNELVSILEFEDGSIWSLFPNPTTGIITLHTDKIMNEIQVLEVYNSLGTLQLSESFQIGLTEFKINLNELAQGVYILKMNDIFLGKILKSN